MLEVELGDLVFATWVDDGFLYPCVIVSVEDEFVHVAYLDGDEGDVSRREIYRGEFSPGLAVSINFKGKGLYYPGRILSSVGMAIEIQYDDGEYGWASIAQCRVPAAHFSPSLRRPSPN